MEHVAIERSADLAVVRLQRGKVNALTLAVVEELFRAFAGLEAAADVSAVILTGRGKFFSFGFDIPHFYPQTRREFTEFLHAFTGLYRDLYRFPKPVVAALNGHTIAGGCMIATACDRRVMVGGRGRISLNEVTFGSSVFAGCVEMLQGTTGRRNAETILLTGAMLSADEAHALGLVDRVVAEEELLAAAEEEGRRLIVDPAAFRSVKRLLRGPAAERMEAREEASIREFVDLWYSERTRENLRKIEIRS